MGYWKAFHAPQPHRLVAAAALPAERVLSEQLVHNAQVKGFAPQHAVVRALPAALVPVLGPCPSVAAVRRVLHASDVVLSPAMMQRVGMVRALLPEAWTSFFFFFFSKLVTSAHSKPPGAASQPSSRRKGPQWPYQD